MSYCSACGAELSGTESFCAECGAPVETNANETDQPEQHPPDSQSTRQSPDAGSRTPQGDQSYRQSAAGQRPSASQSAQDAVTRRELVAYGGGLAALAGAGWFVFLRDGSVTGGESKPPLDEMEVGFVDVRVPDAGLGSATIPIILSFSNPTDQTIPSPSGDLDIFINDIRVGSEEIVVNELEPGEETNVNIDIIVEYADYGSALIDAITTQSFSVRVTGTLNAEGASREFTVSGSV